MFFSDLKIAFHTKISCWCHKTTLQFESIIINCIDSKPAIALAFPCSFQILFHRFVHQYYINAQTYLIFAKFITPAYFDVWKICVKICNKNCLKTKVRQGTPLRNCMKKLKRLCRNLTLCVEIRHPFHVQCEEQNHSGEEKI